MSSKCNSASSGAEVVRGTRGKEARGKSALTKSEQIACRVCHSGDAPRG